MGRPIEKRHLYVTTKFCGEFLVGIIQGSELPVSNGFVCASNSGGNVSGVRLEEVISYRTASLERES